VYSHSRRHLALSLLKLADAACFVLAYFGIRIAIHHAHGDPWESLWPLASAEVVLIAVALACWQQLLDMRGLHSSRRLEQAVSELWDIAVVVSLQTCFVSTGALLLGVIEVANGAFAVGLWALMLSFSVGSRLLMRVVLRVLRSQGRNLRFALVIGSGPRAQRLAATLTAGRGSGYRLIGCVDDTEPPVGGCMKWLGPIGGLPRVLSDNVVDEVFVALPVRSGYSSIESVVQWCEEQGVAVTMPADFIPVRFARMRISQLEQRVLLRLSSVPEESWQLVAKRLIDVFASVILVAALLPAFLAIVVVIRATSPGPAVFRQTRIGLNKRPFTLYKFRTMVMNAERTQSQFEAFNESSGPVFKMREDPRVTPFGRWLRRTSLDELPQLFNVIQGNMSLVGPRPLPVCDVQGFNEDWQRRRFSVLPGITCLWQMSGRSNISFERWMEMDLEYIDQWSLWLDFSILMKTMPAVLKREGAY